MKVRLYGNSQKEHFWHIIPLADIKAEEQLIHNFIDSNKKELIEKFISQTTAFYYLMDLKLDDSPEVASSEKIKFMYVPRNWIEELSSEDKMRYILKIKNEVAGLGKDSNITCIVTLYYHLIEKLQEKNSVRGSPLCYQQMDVVYNENNRKICGHLTTLRHLYQHSEINGELELNFIIKLLESISNKNKDFLECVLNEINFINDLYLLPENLELKKTINHNFRNEVVKKLDKKIFKLRDSVLPIFCRWLMTLLNSNNYGGKSFEDMQRNEFASVVSFCLEQECSYLVIKVQGLYSHIPSKIKLIPSY